ncbi:hypothetical protein CA85_21760 [Allorhodopirellula solitaria]|uniref:Uncharacterized protein n=1 Tax=Allorhodopirellula solitaria TaxID=2527987 RepID=A0A5C5XVH1_9BACT|nr:hypothetical protein CA85_21760 [Allorhodopirellula solitaria]
MIFNAIRGWLLRLASDPVVFAYAQTTGYFRSSLSGYLLVTKGARAVGIFHRQILSELRIGASSDGRSRLATIVLAQTVGAGWLLLC